MTIKEFQYLSEPEQDEYIWDFGIFLANYVDGNLMCDTYFFMNFYVSFFYKLNEDDPPKIVAHYNQVTLPLKSHLKNIKDFRTGL